MLLAQRQRRMVGQQIDSSNPYRSLIDAEQVPKVRAELDLLTSRFRHRNHASFLSSPSARTIAGLTAGVSLAARSSGGGEDQVKGKLSGAGASFPAAIYTRWFQERPPKASE